MTSDDINTSYDMSLTWTRADVDVLAWYDHQFFRPSRSVDDKALLAARVTDIWPRC